MNSPDTDMNNAPSPTGYCPANRRNNVGLSLITAQAGRIPPHTPDTMRKTIRGAFVSTFAFLTLAASAAAIPNPGTGSAPPGAGKLLELLKWSSWIVFGLCVCGVLYAAAELAINGGSGRGSGGHHTKLLWILGACVIAGSASGIVGALA